MARKAKSGDKVSVHYTGRLEDGSVFDSSEGKPPLQFEVGSGEVIRGFDDAVAGMSVGDRKEVRITPNEAYGERRNELSMEVPRSQLPEGVEPKKGDRLGLRFADGTETTARIVAVDDEVVVIDLNHPLAGETLIFDLELIDVKD